MRHFTSGSTFSRFLKLVVLAVLFLWATSIFLASPQDADAPAALGLRSFSSISPAEDAGGPSPSISAEAHAASDQATADALARLEAQYTRERQERLELQKNLDDLLTKQQDLQGQLDILRQQMPLPEERTEGAAKPPEIGYTRWAKNYYNTRRDDDADDAAAAAEPNDASEKTKKQQQQQPMESIAVAGQKGITLPHLKAAAAETTAPKQQQQQSEAVLAEIKRAQEEGLESSEGGQCVLPKKLDYKKDFWTVGRAFVGCCRAGNCNNYQLRDKGRFLLSTCDETAQLAWGQEKRSVAPNQLFSLAKIPQVQYVKFTCKGVEELVTVPMTNEQAHKRALAHNAKQALAHNATSTTAAAVAKPNVVVLMIDALSRAQFVRALPETLGLFDKWRNDAEARFSVFDFEFFGTLGAYSPPNRYAFFSGFPFGDNQAFFDGSPFPIDEKALRTEERTGVWMWDVLSAEGYMTYSARDMCSKAASFVYEDFVSRPWTDVHFQDIFCDFGSKGHASAAEHCLKTRYAHQYVLESGALFHEAHTNVPRFAYLDFAEGHEPSMRIVRTMDKDLVEFLPRFLADQNTIVVLASDHGIGYGKQHITKDGPLEERLPALYVIAPNRVLAKEARAQLVQNTRKLVTGLDVFATVADFAGVPASVAERRPWAHSLAREMASRNCREAGINVHACPCSLWDGATKSRITWK